MKTFEERQPSRRDDYDAVNAFIPDFIAEVAHDFGLLPETMEKKVMYDPYFHAAFKIMKKRAATQIDKETVRKAIEKCLSSVEHPYGRVYMSEGHDLLEELGL